MHYFIFTLAHESDKKKKDQRPGALWKFRLQLGAKCTYKMGGGGGGGQSSCERARKQRTRKCIKGIKGTFEGRARCISDNLPVRDLPRSKTNARTHTHTNTHSPKRHKSLIYVLLGYAAWQPVELIYISYTLRGNAHLQSCISTLIHTPTHTHTNIHTYTHTSICIPHIYGSTYRPSLVLCCILRARARARACVCVCVCVYTFVYAITESNY